jgi:outer membrane protein OmpA-like peptidoglycan-associated protein
VLEFSIEDFTMNKNALQKILLFFCFSCLMTAVFVLLLHGPVERQVYADVVAALGEDHQQILIEVKGREVFLAGSVEDTVPSSIVEKLSRVDHIHKVHYNLKFAKPSQQSVNRTIASMPEVKVDPAEKPTSLANTPIQEQLNSKRYSVYFFYKSAELKPESLLMLSELVDNFPGLNQKHIQLQGYTDDIGPDSYNFKLSKERANTILHFLVSRGADYRKVALYYKGEAIFDDRYNKREKNRRVDLIISDNTKVAP